MDKLNKIIKEKNTRLCFSADFKKSSDLIKWINITGPHICLLKTHIDIIEDFSNDLIENLIKLKKKYNFLIFEDRKFSDIGKIFHHQLFNGIYKIASWADIITIHGICSDGMLDNLKDFNNTPKVLLVAQMSSKNNIIDTKYTNNCYKIALKYKNLVIGFISQTKFVEDNNFLFLTPCVNINNNIVKDQIYKTPEKCFQMGFNIIIVGSGIYNNKNSIDNIILYK